MNFWRSHIYIKYLLNNKKIHGVLKSFRLWMQAPKIQKEDLNSYDKLIIFVFLCTHKVFFRKLWLEKCGSIFKWRTFFLDIIEKIENNRLILNN